MTDSIDAKFEDAPTSTPDLRQHYRIRDAALGLTVTGAALTLFGITREGIEWVGLGETLALYGALISANGLGWYITERLYPSRNRIV